MCAQNRGAAQIRAFRFGRNLDGLCIVVQRLLRLSQLLMQARAQQVILGIAGVLLNGLFDVRQRLRRLAARRQSRGSHRVGARIVRLQSQRLCQIRNRAGVVAQIVVRVSAVQKRRVVLRIQLDGFGKRLDGRPVGLQIFRTPAALECFLSFLPIRRRACCGPPQEPRVLPGTWPVACSLERPSASVRPWRPWPDPSPTIADP